MLGSLAVLSRGPCASSRHIYIPNLHQIYISLEQEYLSCTFHVPFMCPTCTFHVPHRDGDGHLTAEELVAALNTHGVDITLEQADIIIQAVDADENGTIELEEFPQLIYGLAALDRASNELTAGAKS